MRQVDARERYGKKRFQHGRWKIRGTRVKRGGEERKESLDLDDAPPMISKTTVLLQSHLAQVKSSSSKCEEWHEDDDGGDGEQPPHPCASYRLLLAQVEFK